MFSNAVPSQRSTRSKLPPGRHGLSRSFVAQNQRDRILASVADACSAKGYGKMSVEDIIAAAGVSPAHVLRALQEQGARVPGRVRRRGRPAVRPRERSGRGRRDAPGQGPRRAGERSSASSRASRHSRAMCIVDVLAAGSEAVARRDGAMRGFSQLILQNVRDEIGENAPPALDVISETVVGGIYEVVYARVLRARVRRAPAPAARPRLRAAVAVHGPARGACGVSPPRSSRRVAFAARCGRSPTSPARSSAGLRRASAWRSCCWTPSGCASSSATTTIRSCGCST